MNLEEFNRNLTKITGRLYDRGYTAKDIIITFSESKGVKSCYVYPEDDNGYFFKLEGVENEELL